MGLVAGKRTKTIAKEAGCSKRHVERLAAEPETQFLITEAMRPHRKKLEKLATKAIAAVEKALGAKKKSDVDHFIRLRAVERFGDLAEMAQGTEEPEATDEIHMTWEAFQKMYEARGKK